MNEKSVTEAVLEKRLIEEMNKSISFEIQLIEQSQKIEEVKTQLKEDEK